MTEPHQPPIPLKPLALPPDDPTPVRPEVSDWHDPIYETNDISLGSHYGHLTNITFSAGHEVLEQLNSVEIIEPAGSEYLNKFGEQIGEDEMTVRDVLHYLDRDGKHIPIK